MQATRFLVIVAVLLGVLLESVYSASLKHGTGSSEYYSTNVMNTRTDERNITCTVGYSQFRQMTSSWSWTELYEDDKSEYVLLDYSNYASTLEEFIQKYPTFTIDTIGQAISMSTFGDVGKNKFGRRIEYTNEFIVTGNVFKKSFVRVLDSKFACYNILISIGVNLKTRGTELIINPYIVASLQSHGAYERVLDYGLGVSQVTFKPMQPTVLHV